MDVYTQALSPARHEAQARVADTILPRGQSNIIGQFWILAPKPDYR